MKRMICALAIGIGLVLAFVGCGGGGGAQQGDGTQQEAQEKYTLKVADHFPGGHIIAKEGPKYFMERATELTNGRVEFEYFPAEQLGQVEDILELTQSGAADIGDISPSYNSEVLPAATLGTLPGLTPSSCAGTQALDQVLQEEDGFLYREAFASQQIRPLVAVMFPPYDIYTTDKKVTVPDDFRGLKMRSAGGAMNTTIRTLGAAPVQMSAPDVYTSMERGTLDGTLFAATSVNAYKLYELLNYFTTGVSMGSYMQTYSISDQAWNKLPPDIQDALTQAGQDTDQHLCSTLDKETAGLHEKFIESGMQKTELSPQEQRLWQDEFRKVQEKWAQDLDSRGQPGSGALEAMREAVEAVNKKD